MVEGCAGEVISVLSEPPLMVDILFDITVLFVVVDKSGLFGLSVGTGFSSAKCRLGIDSVQHHLLN